MVHTPPSLCQGAAPFPLSLPQYDGAFSFWDREYFLGDSGGCFLPLIPRVRIRFFGTYPLFPKPPATFSTPPPGECPHASLSEFRVCFPQWKTPITSLLLFLFRLSRPEAGFPLPAMSPPPPEFCGFCLLVPPLPLLREMLASFFFPLGFFLGRPFHLRHQTPFFFSELPKISASPLGGMPPFFHRKELDGLLSLFLFCMPRFSSLVWLSRKPRRIFFHIL